MRRYVSTLITGSDNQAPPLFLELFRAILPGSYAASGAGRAQSLDLFKDLFGRDRQAVGAIGRAVGDLDQVMAERALEFARGPAPRGKLDPAEAGMAFGTDDIAFFHRVIMPFFHNRSTTAVLSPSDVWSGKRGCRRRNVGDVPPHFELQQHSVCHSRPK